MRANCAIKWCVWMMAVASGCQDSTTESSGNAAEVPGPGPAVAEIDIGPPPPGQTEPPLPDSSDSQESSTGDEATDVSLSIRSWDEAQQLVASKAGKVVVLDLWSTSCVPCRREFPHLVQLHREHGDEVACISFSMDYAGRASKPPETYREKVTEFLQSQGATFDNILGNDDPDALYEQLDLAAIPAVYVYDREGMLLKRFDNEDPEAEEFTYEQDILPFVNELLTKN